MMGQERARKKGKALGFCALLVSPAQGNGRLCFRASLAPPNYTAGSDGRVNSSQDTSAMMMPLFLQCPCHERLVDTYSLRDGTKNISHLIPSLADAEGGRVKAREGTEIFKCRKADSHLRGNSEKPHCNISRTLSNGDFYLPNEFHSLTKFSLFSQASNILDNFCPPPILFSSF